MSRREFAAVSVAMEYREETDQHRGDKHLGRTSPTTITPRRIADKAMPISMPGSGMPSSPIIAPIDMTIGNVTGRSHIAGLPS